MKKILAIVPLVSALGLLLWTSSSAEEKTVNATITPLVISISVTPNTISYGTQQAGVGEVVSTPPSITVANTGSVAQDFQIKGANSSSSEWNLASTAGTNQFVHLFSTNNSTFTDLTTDYKNLQMNVAPAGNISLYMRLVIPTVITATSPQTLPFKILSLQH